MRLSRISDELKAGDTSCLKVLFEEHGHYCISNLMNFRNCSREDAEDIFIEAIINFHDKILLEKITYLTSVRSYLYGTCVNMHKSLLTRQNSIDQKTTSIKKELYTSELNIEEKIVEHEHLEDLSKFANRTFKALDPACQQLLKYFFIHELSMERIATLMGLATKNVAKTKKLRCYKRWMQKVNELQNTQLS